MNIRVIARFLGVVVLAVGAAMLCAVPWGIYFHETVGIRALLVSSAVAAAIGGALHLFGRTGPADLYRKESLAVVALGWLFATAVGALPYLLSGTLTSVIDATFEAMSGFTTTGSTVLTAIEAAPRSILFWRDFTHWLGGMGIVVLFIAILPTLGVGGRHLFFSEIPGAVKEDISPRIKSTASMLWKVYVGLSVIEMAALRAAGMSFYDAQCHTFGTMATGGFSTRAASIGAYDSLPIELIVIVFMVLAGTNFSLHVALVRGAPRRLVGDPEWRAYLVIMGVAILLVSFDALGHGLIDGVGTALRQASFQVVSIMTTTGYGTADFEQWPSLSKLLLVTLMFVGGCSGSTGGGMKVLRALVLGKFAYHQVQKIFEPHAVLSMKIGRMTLREETVRDILGFFILFMGIFIAASLIMSMLGLDMVSATSSVAATLCNIGPGLGIVGPADDFSTVPPLGKLVLVACMLLGRLEIYTVMSLVVPRFWRG